MKAVRHNIYTTIIFSEHMLKMSPAKGTHAELNFSLITILSQRRLRVHLSQTSVYLNILLKELEISMG